MRTHFGSLNKLITFICLPANITVTQRAKYEKCPGSTNQITFRLVNGAVRICSY